MYTNVSGRLPLVLYIMNVAFRLSQFFLSLMFGSAILKMLLQQIERRFGDECLEPFSVGVAVSLLTVLVMTEVNRT